MKIVDAFFKIRDLAKTPKEAEETCYYNFYRCKREESYKLFFLLPVKRICNFSCLDHVSLNFYAINEQYVIELQKEMSFQNIKVKR